MPEYLSPGVYVEEYDSGARVISGVSTSVPGFLGLAKKGPLDGLPQLITNISDFRRKYGGYLPRAFKDFRYLSYAVEQFFVNGGSRCYVMRIENEGLDKASCVLLFTRRFAGMLITAKKKVPENFILKFSPCQSEGVALTPAGSGGDKYTCGLALAIGDVVLVRNKDSIEDSFYLTVSSVGSDCVEFAGMTEDMIALITDGKAEIFCSNFKMEANGKVFDLSLNPKSDKYVVDKTEKEESIVKVAWNPDEEGALADLFGWITTGGCCSIEVCSGEPYIKVTAKDAGEWGNSINIEIEAVNTLKIPASLAGNGVCAVSDSSCFRPGDVAEVVISRPNKDAIRQYLVVKEQNGKSVIFNGEISSGGLKDEKCHILTCEMCIKVSYDGTDEIYERVTLNADSPDYIGKRLSASSIVTVEADDSQITQTLREAKHPFNMLFPAVSGTKQTVALSGGSDGDMSKIDADSLYTAFVGDGTQPGKKTGIEAFADNDSVSLMCAPGVTDAKLQSSLVSHCELYGNRFAILDVPGNCNTVEKILAFKENVISSYAALYHPWLTAYDPLDKMNAAFPPSGAVAGIYARVDQNRGVHKAPANEALSGILGLECTYSQVEQSVLNPKGVNLIMRFSGQGIRVWGARTCSYDSLWRYVNVRRLFIYIRESIKASTSWVVFEPNDSLLWLRVKIMVTEFLRGVWKSGALAGASEDEAFYVEIGESTMTRDDIDNGRLICNIGIAPVKPAEFVIFRITQKTTGS